MNRIVMGGRRRVTSSAVVALALVVLLAACAQPSPGQQRPGIGGKLFAVDDTGLPDTPATGTILAIPRKEGIAWVRASNPQLSLPQYRYAVVKFTRTQIEGLGGVIVHTDEVGDFWLPVRPGRYLLCYAQSSADTSVSGCYPLTLPDHGTIRATRGEGGFTARLE